MKKTIITLLMVAATSTAFAQSAATVMEQSDKFPTGYVFVDYQYELTAVDGVLYMRNRYEDAPCILVRYPTGRQADTFVIPEGVTRICDNAFEGVELNSIHIPSTVRFIGLDAFRNARIGQFITDNDTPTPVTSQASKQHATQVHDTSGIVQSEMNDPHKVYLVTLANGQTVKVRLSR